MSWGSSGIEIQLHASCRSNLTVKIGLTILPLNEPMWTLFDVRDGLPLSTFLVILWASLMKLGSKMQTFQETQTWTAFSSPWKYMGLICLLYSPQAPGYG